MRGWRHNPFSTKTTNLEEEMMEVQKMVANVLSPLNSPYSQADLSITSVKGSSGSGCCGCKTCSGDGDCGPSGCTQVWKSSSPFVFASVSTGCRGCSTCSGDGCGPSNCNDYTANRWNA